MHSETNELTTALVKAQALMKAAVINRINPHFKNRYADLASVLEAVRGPLSANGLAITQTTQMRKVGFVLVTTLRHVSGQWLESVYPLPVGAKPQELGSALTYGRRYSISALVCIAADEDDDAEGAQNAGGDRRITPEEAQDLVDMAEACGADQQRMLAAGGVEKVTDMTVSIRDDLMAKLRMKNPKAFDKEAKAQTRRREAPDAETENA